MNSIGDAPIRYADNFACVIDAIGGSIALGNGYPVRDGRTQ
jgi:hypothetical protein